MGFFPELNFAAGNFSAENFASGNFAAWNFRRNKVRCMIFSQQNFLPRENSHLLKTLLHAFFSNLAPIILHLSNQKHLGAILVYRSSLFSILQAELAYGVSSAVWHTKTAGFRD